MMQFMSGGADKPRGRKNIAPHYTGLSHHAGKKIRNLRPISPSLLANVKHYSPREDFIANEIQQMGGHESAVYPMKFIAGAEGKSRGKSMNMTMTNQSNQIFGPPEQLPVPRPRLRDNNEDLMIRLSHHSPSAKDVAQHSLADGPTMIDRMVANQYPRPVQPDHHRGKKCLGGLETLLLPEQIPMGVEGFRGMGFKSQPPPLTGRNSKPAAPFSIPTPPDGSFTARPLLRNLRKTEISGTIGHAERQ